jgi:serine/threonine-protein kinase
MKTRLGKHIGRYEIVAELGRGGMGVLYQARDSKIDRFVAVKIISLSTQDPEMDREYRERFRLEAQAAGRLVHPGIVTVFDVGEHFESCTPFIVMPGQSLSRMLSHQNGKLRLDEALWLTETLAETLDYAHTQGVVHRDIKPTTILVTDDGRAKITAKVGWHDCRLRRGSFSAFFCLLLS